MLYVEAAAFAACKHRTQRRKNASADPYINHPLQVARILTQCGERDEQVLVAAVLHDTVEDTATTAAELEKVFGVDVAQLVVEVTDDKKLGKVERKRAQIAHSPHVSRGAKLIKLADKYDNLRGLLDDPPVGWSAERVQGYFVWSRHVCDGCRGVNDALERRLDALFSASFVVDGVRYDCIPTGEPASELLERYYALLSADERKGN